MKQANRFLNFVRVMIGTNPFTTEILMASLTEAVELFVDKIVTSNVKPNGSQTELHIYFDDKSAILFQPSSSETTSEAISEIFAQVFDYEFSDLPKEAVAKFLVGSGHG